MVATIPVLRQALSKFLLQPDLDENYTLYSFRHTFTLDLYRSLLGRGMTGREAILKMLPITRHRNENGLRGVGASMPKDYEDIYTIGY